jgi:hypothetical protein
MTGKRSTRRQTRQPPASDGIRWQSLTADVNEAVGVTMVYVLAIGAGAMR